GPGGLNLTPAASYVNNTGAGTATASYTFAATANYNGSSGSKDFTIEKADPKCSVAGYSVTYDGNAHTATGSCTGVGGVSDVLSGPDLSLTTHMDAGDFGADSWSRAESANYKAAGGTVHDHIEK